MTTQEMTEAQAYESHSRTIVDSDGKTLGKVDEIYLDDRTQKPEWAKSLGRPALMDNSKPSPPIADRARLHSEFAVAFCNRSPGSAIMESGHFSCQMTRCGPPRRSRRAPLCRVRRSRLPDLA